MTVTQRMFLEIEKQGKTIASLCSFINVKSNVVANWKTQNTIPPAKYLVTICEFLRITTDYLLTGKESLINSTPAHTQNEQEMLDLFTQIPDREQIKLIGELESRINQLKSRQKQVEAEHMLLSDDLISLAKDSITAFSRDKV